LNIILASASPRRLELLSSLGDLHITVIPSNIKEDELDTLEPCVLATTLAFKKAKAVHEKNRDTLVLGADTIVVINDEVLGKPKDEAEAKEFFKKLCGRPHEVITGVALLSKENILVNHDVTIVTFKPYDERIVSNYLKTNKPFDKAGGYGIQDEELKNLIDSVDGDLTNVIGLPLNLVKEMIRGI